MFNSDKKKALLYVYSGAGGVDAQDWASMLLKMYQRFAQRRGWGFSVVHQSLGEQRGIKNASCEITGFLPFRLKNCATPHLLWWKLCRKSSAGKFSLTPVI